jgi:hypothetical protein
MIFVEISMGVGQQGLLLQSGHNFQLPARQK